LAEKVGDNLFFIYCGSKNSTMKKRLTGFLIFSACALLFQNCAYNTREEAPGPQNTCDSTIKYTYADIEPILTDQGCNACHKPGGQRPSSDLSDATKVRNYIRANEAKFINSMKFQGDTPMPKGGPAMPDTDQKKLEAWICQGMK
jgi:hypothetical protein